MSVTFLMEISVNRIIITAAETNDQGRGGGGGGGLN
jgi:hypothetical protein